MECDPPSESTNEDALSKSMFPLPPNWFELDPIYHVPVKLFIFTIKSSPLMDNNHPVLSLHNRPVRFVEIVGIVTQIRYFPDNIMLTVDDSTSNIVCTYWLTGMSKSKNRHHTILSRNAIEIGSLVRIRGQVHLSKLVQTLHSRSIGLKPTIHKPDWVEDVTDIDHHWEEDEVQPHSEVTIDSNNSQHEREINIQAISLETDLNTEVSHWLEVMRLDKEEYSEQIPVDEDLMGLIAMTNPLDVVRVHLGIKLSSIKSKFSFYKPTQLTPRFELPRPIPPFSAEDLLSVPSISGCIDKHLSLSKGINGANHPATRHSTMSRILKTLTESGDILFDPTGKLIHHVWELSCSFPFLNILRDRTEHLGFPIATNFAREMMPCEQHPYVLLSSEIIIPLICYCLYDDAHARKSPMLQTWGTKISSIQNFIASHLGNIGLELIHTAVQTLLDLDWVICINQSEFRLAEKVLVDPEEPN